MKGGKLMAVGIVIFILGAMSAIAIFVRGQKAYIKRDLDYRRDKGRYYFEDGKLTLNSKNPYPQAALIEEIEHVLFTYDIWTIKNQFKYWVSLTIVKKDGTSMKKVSYVGFKTGSSPLLPEEVAKDLEDHGIKCVLPQGKGTIFGNRS